MLLAYIDQDISPTNLNNPIFMLQRELPYTKIVVRRFHPEDFRFHMPGTDEGWIMSPGTFLAKYGWLGRNGRTLQVMNEPNGYSDIEALVAWTCEVIRLASATNVSLTIMNLGVGHPNITNPAGVLEQWDARFEPVLRLLAQYRDQRNLPAPSANHGPIQTCTLESVAREVMGHQLLNVSWKRFPRQVQVRIGIAKQAHGGAIIDERGGQQIRMEAKVNRLAIGLDPRVPLAMLVRHAFETGRVVFEYATIPRILLRGEQAKVGTRIV